MEKILVKIDKDIRILRNDLTVEQRYSLIHSFSFQASKGFGQKKEVANIWSYDVNTKELVLPCNVSFVIKCLDNLGVNYEIEDTRYAEKLASNLGINTTIQLRENQQELFEQLEAVDFNAIIASATSFGKSLLSIYIAQQLNVRMVFIASKVSLLENFVKECRSFGVLPEQITKIDSEWVKNPIYSEILYCTGAALCNESVTYLLKDKVQLIVVEELHLGILGTETRKALQEFNPRYRIGLSATYKSMQFEGLNEAFLSDNILSVEETFKENIGLHNLNIAFDNGVVTDFYATQAYHIRKKVLFQENEELLHNVVNMVNYIVMIQKRGVMIYIEDIFMQEALAKLLREDKVRVGILNTNTVKKESINIIEKFDKGVYDCIIGGVTVNAGLSFYRLSVFINMNITTNANALQQAVGRLKRWNPKVSKHTKEFIQLTYIRISETKWRKDKKALSEFGYITETPKVLVDIQTEWADDRYLELVEGYKKLGIK